MSFYETVYDIVCKIPKGKVATYGKVALMAGYPRRARQVGFALHVNPKPKIIPCHRVVFADGRLTSGFAFGGLDAQRKLLEAEGVFIDEQGKVDLKEYGWVAF